MRPGGTLPKPAFSSAAAVSNCPAAVAGRKYSTRGGLAAVRDWHGRTLRGDEDLGHVSARDGDRIDSVRACAWPARALEPAGRERGVGGARSSRSDLLSLRRAAVRLSAGLSYSKPKTGRTRLRDACSTVVQSVEGGRQIAQLCRVFRVPATAPKMRSPPLLVLLLVFVQPACLLR